MPRQACRATSTTRTLHKQGVLRKISYGTASPPSPRDNATFALCRSAGLFSFFAYQRLSWRVCRGFFTGVRDLARANPSGFSQRAKIASRLANRLSR